MKNQYATRILLASALLGIPFAAAQATDSLDMPDTYFYVGGHVGQYYYDFNSMNGVNDRNGGRGMTDTTLPGAQLGWRFAPNWSTQISWARNEYSWKNSNDDGYMTQVLLSERYHFKDSTFAGFEPYLGFTGGRLMEKKQGTPSIYRNKMREAVLGAELGAQTMLLPYLSLDLGARPLWILKDKRWDGEIFAGLNFILGAKRSGSEQTSVAAAQPAQEPAAQPAPVTEALAAVVVGDADRDGVPDANDKCPNTAAGVKVDAKGCELDTDGDGVADSQDKCPNTPAGALVDANGCQQVLTKDIRELLYVQFTTGKAQVTEASYPEIEKIAKLAKQYPDAKVTLVGYTDSTGAAAVNQRLSGQRADAVKQALVERYGVDADRISTEGRGAADPIADNGTVAGRAQNRRVEVTLKAQAVEKQFKSN